MNTDMKLKYHFIVLLLAIACLLSCVLRINNPNRPPLPPPGGQPWWYDTDHSGRTMDTIIVIINDDETDNDDNIAPPTPTDEDTTPDFVPTSKYEVDTIDGVMTFNVYLGWAIDRMETVVLLRDYPAEGGEIIFNIYTNHLSMSMYGFEKYRTDFYVFFSEPPYCGYSSYSLDTQGLCKYKMIIKENMTNAERVCSGYWACNDGGRFYSSFKIVLYQNCK